MATGSVELACLLGCRFMGMANTTLDLLELFISSDEVPWPNGRTRVREEGEWGEGGHLAHGTAIRSTRLGAPWLGQGAQGHRVPTCAPRGVA